MIKLRAIALWLYTKLDGQKNYYDIETLKTQNLITSTLKAGFKGQLYMVLIKKQFFNFKGIKLKICSLLKERTFEFNTMYQNGEG